MALSSRLDSMMLRSNSKSWGIWTTSRNEVSIPLDCASLNFAFTTAFNMVLEHCTWDKIVFTFRSLNCFAYANAPEQSPCSIMPHKQSIPFRKSWRRIEISSYCCCKCCISSCCRCNWISIISRSFSIWLVRFIFLRNIKMMTSKPDKSNVIAR